MANTTISELATTVCNLPRCAIDASVWSWANAYKVSITIFALNQLGILRSLTREALTSSQLAVRFSVSEELIVPLLDLLCSVQILQRNADQFVASSSLEAVLPLVAMEAHVSATHLTAAQIVNVLQTGAPADIFQKSDVQQYVPVFTAAMRSSARTLAPHLVRFAGLTRCRKLLDLGGADGSLACAVQRMVPNLSITVIDLPRMAPAFAQNDGNQPESGIQFHAGDLRDPESLRDQFHDTDVIVLSNALHLLTTAHRSALFEVIRRSSPAAARLLVYDQFIEEGPLDATHFMSVDWIVNGVAFRESADSYAATLAGAGFVDVHTRRFSGLPGALLSARV
jgi:hypothetical protein